jgi:biopolymer transport protein ExbB/TolQ
VIWNVVFLLIRPTSSIPARRKSIDAVLFWGGVAAVLGMLGQWMGIHKMTNAIHEHGIVSPSAVAIGISESLWTPLAGMVVLAGAAVLWSLLRLRLWSIEQRASH